MMHYTEILSNTTVIYYVNHKVNINRLSINIEDAISLKILETTYNRISVLS